MSVQAAGERHDKIIMHEELSEGVYLLWPPDFLLKCFKSHERKGLISLTCQVWLKFSHMRRVIAI